jgi:hypothetical protein
MKSILIFTSILLLFFCYLLNRDIKNLRKENFQLVYQLDSIKNENFINYTNYHRYEIAASTLTTEFKECGKKFDKILDQLE